MRPILFLYLFFALFFVAQKIDAAFFNPSPYQQNFGSIAYAAHWNPAGTYLAIGGSNFPQDLTIYELNDIYTAERATVNFGTGVYAIDWTPNGKYLAVGGDNGTKALIVYNWDGAALTLTTSKYHGTQANAVAWNPNGNTLAVGGIWGYNDLAVYSWDGSSTLTLTTSKFHGTTVNGLAWHPDGTKLAVAGNNSGAGRFCNLGVYDWTGSALTITTSKHHGTESFAVAWNHAGTHLAVGGNYSYNDVALYAWNGSILTLTTSVSFGTKATTLDWTFDDQYLVVGGDNDSTDLIVYKWNGTTLTKIYDSQTSYGNGVYGAAWSPYAEYLAVAGDNTSYDFSLYANHGYLNGTKNNIIISDHYLFTDGGYANGTVHIANGCTVLPAQTLTLALLAPFSGGLDLRGTGRLELEDDLYLDASVTLSAGGYINGQGHALYLGNNLTIPDYAIMHIASDTIIDGNGHDLILGNESQLFVDWGVTLTLRNLTLKNSVNNQSTPPVRLNGPSSKLALDNSTLALSSDFSFTYGQLFIHNDVFVTGTSQFNYLSPRQSYIDNNSTLYFDIGTTFSFAPYLSTNKDLLYMKDISSALYLDGATLAVTHTGLRLTRGKLLLDNAVTFTSRHYEGAHKQALTNSIVFGNAALGTNYDLDVQLLAGAYVDVHGLVNYDCAG